MFASVSMVVSQGLIVSVFLSPHLDSKYTQTGISIKTAATYNVDCPLLNIQGQQSYVWNGLHWEENVSPSLGAAL